jgi:20S proteasome alpha/beta subunit
MTVCIGALATKKDNHSENVIVASDRMVSLGNFMEFEHEVSKIGKLSSKCVALVAGDTLIGSQIVDTSRAKIAEFSNLSKVADIAKLVATIYVETRDRIIEEQVFRPRGFTRADFYNVYQTQLLQNIAFQLDNQVATWNIGVEIIVAGVDDLGAHVYTINHPGIYTDVYQIGYTAVGSGAIHATQALIGFAHSPYQELNRTIFCTFAAKKRGEVAPGVGKETDLFIISKDGIKELTQDEIKELDEIYNKDYYNPLTKQVQEKIEKLNFFKEVSK